jgi:hypothetical protein
MTFPTQFKLASNASKRTVWDAKCQGKGGSTWLKQKVAIVINQVQKWFCVAGTILLQIRNENEFASQQARRVSSRNLARAHVLLQLKFVGRQLCVGR